MKRTERNSKVNGAGEGKALGLQRGPRSKLSEMRLVRGAQRLMAEDGAARFGTLIEALTPGTFDEVRAQEAIDGIKARAARVRSGDLSDIERDMCAQIAWLGSLVAYCVEKGTVPGAQGEAGSAWLALALKAGATQARTSATLAQIVLARPRAVND